MGRQGCNLSVNFDGRLFSTTVPTGEVVAYVQLFRNGVIEAVDCQRTDKYLPSVAYEKGIIDSVSDYTGFYRKHEMQTPVLVGLTLLNVKGFRMGRDGTYDIGRPIGVAVGLAMMYAICDLALATPDREELNGLIGCRRPSRPVSRRIAGH